MSTSSQQSAPPRRSRARWVAAALVVLVLAAIGITVALRRGPDDSAAQPAGSAAPSGPTVDVLEAGAVGDGTTDDTAAIQAVFDQARPGETVLLPADHVFAVSDVLTLTSPQVTVRGGGTLLATDEERSSLTLAADGVTLADITLTIATTTKRWDAYEQQRLRLDGHTGITVRDVTIDGSAAAGMYVGGGTSGFLIDGVHVSDTRADGIHITQGAHDGKVVSPVVQDVGDDGVAVVSYAQDGDPCARIDVTSPTVHGSAARGLSVVGGTAVTYSDIDVADTAAAGVYVAAEGSYSSAGVSDVTVDGGTVSDANTSTDIDHGAVLVYDGTADQAVSDVRVTGLTIKDTRVDASRWVGLVSDGDGAISDVSLDDLALNGHGPATLFVSNDDSTTYQIDGWTRDGKHLSDDDVQADAAAPTGLPGAGSPASPSSAGGSATTAAPSSDSTDSTGAAVADIQGDAVWRDRPSVSVMAFGAVGDGRTDDTAAIQAALDAAQPGTAVVLPLGRTFVQSDVLTVRSPGVLVTGGGTLLATDEQRSSLVLAADTVLLRDVTLSISSTTKRWDAYEQQRLRIDGHTGIDVERVTITGSAAAGVYVGGGASGFTLDRVTVSGTRADGIHITQGAHDGQVLMPVVRNVGDDGVAVVSYAQDGTPCARIAVTSPLVDGSTGGRGVSVVGGTAISYRDITVRHTYAAGVYIAAEGGWNSSGVDGVQVTGGTVVDANNSTDLDHGAVLVYDGTGDRAVRNVTISGLTLSGTRASASRWVGLVADSSGSIVNAVLTGITITGGGPGTAFVSNSAGTSYRMSGWQRDGAPLAAQQQG